MLDARNSKVTLLSNGNIWFSAFLGYIVFGNLNNSYYYETSAFRFDKAEYISLYLMVANVISCIAENKEKKACFISREFENVNYFYEIKRNILKEYEICFKLEIAGDVKYSILFNLENFNDFVHIVSQLLIPSVSINSRVQQLLQIACNNSKIEDIKDFSIRENCLKFLQNSNFDQIELEDSSVYLNYYQELLIIVKKLMSMFNPTTKVNNILKIHPL